MYNGQFTSEKISEQEEKSVRMRKRVYVDMDNVLVDFQSGLDILREEVKGEYEGRLDEIPGVFAGMRLMPGVIEAMHRLQEHFDWYILFTAPWKNPSAWSDKGGSSAVPVSLTGRLPYTTFWRRRM